MLKNIILVIIGIFVVIMILGLIVQFLQKKQRESYEDAHPEVKNMKSEGETDHRIYYDANKHRIIYVFFLTNQCYEVEIPDIDMDELCRLPSFLFVIDNHKHKQIILKMKGATLASRTEIDLSKMGWGIDGKLVDDFKCRALDNLLGPVLIFSHKLQRLGSIDINGNYSLTLEGLPLPEDTLEAMTKDRYTFLKEKGSGVVEILEKEGWLRSGQYVDDLKMKFEGKKLVYFFSYKMQKLASITRDGQYANILQGYSLPENILDRFGKEIYLLLENGKGNIVIDLSNLKVFNTGVSGKYSETFVVEIRKSFFDGNNKCTVFFYDDIGKALFVETDDKSVKYVLTEHYSNINIVFIDDRDTASGTSYKYVGSEEKDEAGVFANMAFDYHKPVTIHHYKEEKYHHDFGIKGFQVMVKGKPDRILCQYYVKIGSLYDHDSSGRNKKQNLYQKELQKLAPLARRCGQL